MKTQFLLPLTLLAAMPHSAAEVLASYNSGVIAAAGQSGAADPVAQSWTRAGASTTFSGGYGSGNGGWRTVDGTNAGYASFTKLFSSPDVTKISIRGGWTATWTIALDKDALAVPPSASVVASYYLTPNQARQNDIVTVIDVAADSLGVVVTHKLDASNTVLLDVGGTTYNTGIVASTFPSFATFSLTFDRGAGTTTLNYGAGSAVVTTGAPAVTGRNGIVFGANSQTGQGSAVWNQVKFEVPDGTPPRDLAWTGNSSGTWDLAASNWKLPDSTPSLFANGDKATFGDGASNATITVSGTIIPSSLIFDNPTQAYSLGGDPLSGGATLIKRGGAGLSVTSNLGQLGGLQIEAGNVVIGDGATSGQIPSGPVSLASGASLTLSRSDLLDYKTDPRLRDLSGAGNLILDGGIKVFSYPGTGLGFNEASSWSGFSGNLIIKGGSEFQTIRNGATAMGTGSVVLGDATTSGTLSQIEGNWTWTNAISVIGSANKIINRSQSTPPRTLKIQGVISGAGNLTLEDATGTMNDVNRGFLITGGTTLTGTLTIAAGVPLRVGGVPESASVAPPGSNADAFGSLGTAPVVNEGTLTFSRTDSHTVSAQITGAGKVRIGIPAAANLGDTSTQVVTFSMPQTYTGPTDVERGTLILNAPLPNSHVTVHAGGLLSGTGSFNGLSDIFGTLAPGDGIGTLTSGGDLLFGMNSAYQWQVADWTGTAGTGYDTLVTDRLTLTCDAANPLIVFVSDSGLANFTNVAKSFTLVSTSGGITGFTGNNVLVNSSGFSAGGTWTVTQVNNDLVLNFTPGGPYDAFEIANGIAGAGAGTDSDGDGIANGVEFIIGGDPSGPDSDSNHLLPTLADHGAAVTLSFHLADAAVSIGPNAWSVETTDDLAGTWATVTDGISIIPDGNGPDGTPWSKVDVSIPKEGATQRFARLRAELP